MTAKIYWTTSNQSFRNVKKYLGENGVEYETQYTVSEPLTWEQLLEILLHSENGLEDMISWRSKSCVKLTEQGVDFDELSLTEFHKLTVEHPTLLRMPITVAKNTTLIGYNESDITILRDKTKKKEMFRDVLKTVHEHDRKMLLSV